MAKKEKSALASGPVNDIRGEWGDYSMPRGRKAQAEGRPSFADILIPDKLYFRIGEVSELTETKPYVLRYWETEFPTLKPERRSGHRLYRRKDVEMVFAIKRLLYEEGFTIEGARRHLSASTE